MVIFYLVTLVLHAELLCLKGSQGRDSGFASITTLASSLDYTPSKSSLKLLLPLASYMENCILNPLTVSL